MVHHHLTWHIKILSSLANLIDRFRPCSFSPRLPVASPEVDDVLQHEPDAARQVLVVAHLVDLDEVVVERSQTLTRFFKIILVIHFYV